MNRGLIVFTALCVTACASAELPDGFIYDTSLRGQQGWYGATYRKSAAADLLAAGKVTLPQTALEAELPDAEVSVRRWGLTYFERDWTRYRVILEADVKRDGQKTKCRLSSPEDVADAPLLRELEAEGGAELRARLDGLVAACVGKVLNPTSP